MLHPGSISVANHSPGRVALQDRSLRHILVEESRPVEDAGAGHILLELVEAVLEVGLQILVQEDPIERLQSG